LSQLPVTETSICKLFAFAPVWSSSIPKYMAPGILVQSL
jgi:hypothetical protein